MSFSNFDIKFLVLKVCSREYNKFLSKQKIEPINFLRCKSNGNYESYQQITNYTYCINETDGKTIDRVVQKKYSSQLKCCKHFNITNSLLICF